MKKLASVLVAVAVLLVGFSLSGCLKSATKDLATATLSAPSFPVSTTQASSVKDILSATQTELAKSAVPPTETPAPTEAVKPTAEPTKAPEATATPEPKVIPTLERPETYALKKGEWPICIARRYDLNLDEFFKLNNLNMDSRPAEGTKLKIPATGKWSAAHGNRALNKHPATHTVAAGETIYTIACHYGDVSPEAIAAVNDLKEPYTLKVGDKLQIP